MKSPSHPFQAWIDAMRRSLNLIENYRIIDIDNLRLEFVCAIRQLQLGWPLIAHLKSQQIAGPTDRNSPIPSSHPSTTHPHVLTEEEEFREFCILAQERIIKACNYQHHPSNCMLKPPINLNDLLAVLVTVGHLKPRLSSLRNPDGWEKFRIAPKLFAKSVCILTNSPHDMTEVSGLSFLLTRLEEALEQMPPHSIQWNCKTLPPARPEHK